MIDAYEEFLWLSDIPQKKGFYAPMWSTDEKTDNETCIEVYNQKEPILPIIPNSCSRWISKESLTLFDDLPALKESRTESIVNPEYNNGNETGPDIPTHIEQTIYLKDFPELEQDFDKYLINKWMPWAEQYKIWKADHKPYSKLFTIHQELIKRGEEFELILGIGVLTWCLPTGHKIRRHVIAANASLEFEYLKGCFTVTSHAEGANIHIELDMVDRTEALINGEKEVELIIRKAEDNPWDKELISQTIEALANHMSADSKYYDTEATQTPQTSEKPICEYAPALILRKRSARGLTDVLKHIYQQISSGGIVPKEFADLSELTIKNDVEVNCEKSDAVIASISTPEIYFPKLSNDEQNQIIEKLNSSSGVIVQEPPGTGKSHTIANLICHLLATGKRILITAKTPRALQVLERLIPEEIRSLCISLLGSGLEEKRSLEASVSGILIKDNEWNFNNANDTISCYKQDLYNLRQERANLKHRLRDIREAETTKQSVANGKYIGTAARIAEDIVRDEEFYSWFVDEVPFDKICPLTYSDIISVIELLNNPDYQEKVEFGKILSELPISATKFEDLINSLRKFEKEFLSIEAEINPAMVNNLLSTDANIINNVAQKLTKYQMHKNAIELLTFPPRNSPKIELDLDVLNGGKSYGRKTLHDRADCKQIA